MLSRLIKSLIPSTFGSRKRSFAGGEVDVGGGYGGGNNIHYETKPGTRELFMFNSKPFSYVLSVSPRILLD